MSSNNNGGEQTLSPAGVCNLGSINIAKFVKNGKLDKEGIEKYARYLTRFLDNINSLTLAPLEEYKEFAEKSRRIGVGILGWASALYLMKTRFGSDEAQAIRDNMMELISHTVVDESINLAEEKGMFEWCDPAKHAEAKWFKQIDLPQSQIDRIRKVGIRNSALMSIQPTGNTSIFANIVSGGIEPIFAKEYVRTSIVNSIPENLKGKLPDYWEGEFAETDWFKLAKEGDEDILKYTDENGIVFKIDKSRGLTKETLCEDYAVHEMKKTGEWDSEADWAVDAMSLDAVHHVNDLKGFAKYIDSAISKTINLPFDYSFEDFKSLYLDAYNTRYIKGLTTYRSGTMAAVLSEKKDNDNKGIIEEVIIPTDVKLPDDSPARVKVLRAEGRKWYLTVTYHNDTDQPFALFCRTNSREKSAQTSDAVERFEDLARRKGISAEHIDKTVEKTAHESNIDKLTRMISLLLRHGVSIKNIVLEIDRMEDVFIGSFLFQIKKFLSHYIRDGEKVDGVKCESCGSDKIVYSEGCSKCMSCGSSKCS